MFHLFRWLRDRLFAPTKPRDCTVKPESREQIGVLTQPKFNSTLETPRLVVVPSDPEDKRPEVRERHVSPFRSVTIDCLDPKRKAYFTPGAYAPISAHRSRLKRLDLFSRQVLPSFERMNTRSGAYGTFGARVSHRVNEQE